MEKQIQDEMAGLEKRMFEASDVDKDGKQSFKEYLRALVVPHLDHAPIAGHDTDDKEDAHAEAHKYDHVDGIMKENDKNADGVRASPAYRYYNSTASNPSCCRALRAVVWTRGRQAVRLAHVPCTCGLLARCSKLASWRRCPRMPRCTSSRTRCTCASTCRMGVMRVNSDA